MLVLWTLERRTMDRSARRSQEDGEHGDTIHWFINDIGSGAPGAPYMQGCPEPL